MNVPEWDASKCVGCNQCAFVCSHATIRPFQLTADELAAAPAQTKSRDNRPANEYKFVMAVSPLDCMGCGECVTVCPTKAIAMVPQESQANQQAVFDYCVANISKKPSKFADDTVIGSQFNQPLLEFSGSCAGCAETSYARLITQLFGEKMYISTLPAAPLSGAVPLPSLRTPSTRTAAMVLHGATPCSRITLSMVWACTSARRPFVRT